MLKNAHIWSKGAALIRALGLLAGVQRFVGWRAMGEIGANVETNQARHG